MLFWRRRRRRKILAQAFAPTWRDHLRARVPHYARLREAERARLERMIQLFVAEKHWEGLGGLAIDDEMRVTIAAQACLLLLGFVSDPLRADLYRNVESILVYPSTVVPKRTGTPIFGVTQIEAPIVPLLGEAHGQGPIVLTWDAVRRGAADPHDGHNVVYHEFAHKLDMLDGYSDGTPPLSGRAQYKRWNEVCTREYEALRAKMERGEATLLDPYAGTNASEFFAVITEHFFEQPQELRDEHPELYAVLREFYRQDPAGSSPVPGSG